MESERSAEREEGQEGDVLLIEPFLIHHWKLELAKLFITCYLSF